MEPILLECQFKRATTTIDGGWTVTLATGSDMAEQIVEASKLSDLNLYCVIMTEAQFHAQKQEK